MGKDKLVRFEEMSGFTNVFQPSFDEVFNKDFYLKGKWNEQVFKNNNPIVLELGCGKGEYSVGLAQLYPEKNFIGIDIKGARMWRGAKIAIENKLNNVIFIRTIIQHINSFFAADEISEIWITFPDPQLKRKKLVKKRLTSSLFLSSYKNILKQEGIVHLKTDNTTLYNYTLRVIEHNGFTILVKTDNLYNSDYYDKILSIKTFYETQFTELGENIKYIQFKLNKNTPFIEPEYEE